MDVARAIQRERLFYVEFLALFTGQVSRKDLVLRFGISDPAATKDLSRYADLVPGMLRYDLRRKCYLLDAAKPHFEHDVEQALHSLAGERAIAIDPEHGKRLPSWVNSSIKRKVPVDVVATITRCMYQSRAMYAAYTSLSSGGTERTLTPLALVNDGLRWHIRCFDHGRSDHRDFSLTRFKSVREGDPSKVSLDDDKEWNTEVCLNLAPHPKAEHSEAIRTDYDIVGDAKHVRLKACLVGYFVRHWHVDCSDSASGNPRAQQLFLSNKQELLATGVPRWAFEP